MSPSRAALHAPPAVAVAAVTAGRVRPKAAARGVRRYLPGGWADATLPVNAFVLDHPEGPILVDTGQTARATAPGYLPRWHPFLRLARFELTSADEPAAQLARRGIAAGDVATVILTHLHTDHAGTVDAFPSARVLVARTEWERFGGLRGRVRGYLPQHWPAGLRPRLFDCDGPPLGPFAGTFDLFGDGSVTIVALPGHTPGHVGVIAGGALLAGDLAHDPEEAAVLAPDIVAYCRDSGLALLCAHDEHPPVPGGGR